MTNSERRLDSLRGRTTYAEDRLRSLQENIPTDIIKKIRGFVDLGLPPPPDLRPEHAWIVEEEACLKYITSRGKGMDL